MLNFLNFQIKKLERQNSDLEGAIRRDKARLEVVSKVKGADSLEARAIKARISNNENSLDNNKRKIKRGGF